MMNLSTLRKLSVLMTGIMLISACSTKMPVEKPRVSSPVGVYQSGEPGNFWIVIQENTTYFLCSKYQCESNQYEKLPVSYGVILLDFYKMSTALEIEALSHGKQRSEAFVNRMRQVRLNSHRPDDYAFNIGFCGQVPCVGFGHRAVGLKFLRLAEPYSRLPAHVPLVSKKDN